MTLWPKKLIEPDDRHHGIVVYRRQAPLNFRGLVTGMTIGLTGLVLGLAIVGALMLPNNMMLLLLFGAISPFLAMIIGNTRKLLLTVVLLDIPFQLDVHLFYLKEFEELNAISGLGISATTVALVGLYALWALQLIEKTRPGARVPVWTRNGVALAIYICAAAISILVAQSIVLSFYELFILIQTFLLYIYLVATIRTREEILYVIAVILIGLLLHSFVMISLRIIGHSISVGPLFARIDTGDARGLRVGGTIGSPNTASGYLGLLLAPAFSILFTGLRGRYKLLAGCAFGLGVVALVCTISRGGIIAFGMSMLLFIFLGWRRGWISLTGPLLLLSSSLIVGFFLQDIILSRIFADDQGAALGRVPLVRIALDIILHHPLLGVGTNNFVLALRQYETPEYGRAWFNLVHNKYLLVLTEIGPLGFTAFISFLASTLYIGRKSSRSNDPILAPIALGLTVGVAGHMTHMLFDLFNSRPLVQMLWVVAALMTAIHLLISMTTQKEHQSVEYHV